MSFWDPRAVDCRIHVQLLDKAPHAIRLAPRATRDAVHTSAGRVEVLDVLLVSDNGRHLSQIEQRGRPLSGDLSGDFGAAVPWER